VWNGSTRRSVSVALGLALAACAGGTEVTAQFHEIGNQVGGGEPGQAGPGGMIIDPGLVIVFENVGNDGTTAVVTAEGFEGFSSFPGCFVSSMALPIREGAAWELRLFRGQPDNAPPDEAAFHVFRSQPGLTVPANGMRILEVTINAAGAAITANRIGPPGAAPEPDGPIPGCP
jgi:hypothetical protein